MIASALLVFGLSQAANVYVDSSALPPGDGTLNSPYTRIDFAVDQSPSGTVFLLAPGVYPGESIVTAGKNVQMFPELGAGIATIQGSGSGPIIDASGGGRVLVGNVRFEAGRGYEDLHTGLTYGGAIYCKDGRVELGGCSFSDCRAYFGGAVAAVASTPQRVLRLTDCEIDSSCNAEQSGGGVYVSGFRDFSMEGCEVSSTAIYGQGGCVYVEQGSSFGLLASIRSSTLDGTSYEHGGALAAYGGSWTLNDCTVTGTSREDYFGGGLYQSGGSLYSSRTTFEDCAAVRGGGVYFTGGALAGSANFSECTFRRNRTESFVLQNSGAGGAVACAEMVRFDTCLFIDNRATHHPEAHGGAVSGVAELRSCTLTRNRASSGAGSVSGGAGVVIHNSIVDDASANGVPAISPMANVRYCLLDRPYSGAGTGTLVGEASFWGPSDQHLLPDSDAINRGDPAFHFDSNGTRADIGRYEFIPTWCGQGCEGALGQPACVPAPHSLGFTSQIFGLGSLQIHRDRVVIRVNNLPPEVFGYFIASQTAGFTPGAGGSAGNLCVGGSVLRFSKSPLLSTPILPQVAFRPKLLALPNGGVVLPGQTWYFQFWHRDAAMGGGATSNFSPSIQVDF